MSPNVIIPQVPTLPQRQGEFRRLLNAVTGAELRQIILNQITERLANDKRFSQNLTFPLAVVSFRLDVIVQPREPEHMHLLLENSFGVAEAGTDPETGEPDLERITLDAAWPNSVWIRSHEYFGLDKAPDDIRVENNLNVPRGRREAQSHAAFEESAQEVQDSRRDIRMDSPELEDLSEQAREKYYAVLKKDGAAQAAQLLRAMKSRPHRSIPNSPLADPANRILDAEGRAKDPHLSPDPGQISVHKRDAQGQAAVRADSRHQMKTPQQIAEEMGLAPKKIGHEIPVEELDPRDRPREVARSVTIDRNGPRAARAMEQAAMGAPPANREIKVGQADAIQGRPEFDQAAWEKHEAEMAQRAQENQEALDKLSEAGDGTERSAE